MLFPVLILALKAEEFLAKGQFGLPVPVTQYPIVPDLHKASWQDMQEEAMDELRGIEGHQPHRVIVVAIPVSEGDPAIFQLHQPVIEDGNPMVYRLR